MYPHVLAVRHQVVQVIIDDVRRQVTGTFSGVGDDGVEVDPEVEEADCWGMCYLSCDGVAKSCKIFGVDGLNYLLDEGYLKKKSL